MTELEFAYLSDRIRGRLTARLKDGSTCSYILECNDAEGTTTLLAYTNNK